ncbi:TPA: hypothetical protein DIU27_04800 [Candidatus Collierbacteria bacterium]|uniref:Uncharacterized protein n=1 Tax=Candidatus Collierbacteria bacterium GW2011_GWB2_44_22 TaxID=1618387 RepID=A0A0G1KTJ3_9BACT|nr:MAG: hypothetical protein UW31_C0002G0001 [Candidatus Collierbacteria bacterium GW2011_GWA2_44_13]KKT48909.1 MAG: hypothetical protein UW42_C0044G0004 [Candidatus Collierbacteria bacterium GW2011_GWB1_44_197]KKT51209.1 MAG: hypothetical protein UW44_C0014G0001 [Candidatus Collierbacteria bacterium GW2011_GWB2_44_22]KKT62169.1 MAG: hypothetical protein UW56_C0010G0001 [Candidatus Collierbacteria bacterium GW2011_GWD1_44_27]KKT65680.1 MAG: hypothetical protein UW58_C0023G0023 [Candidatus Colli
MSWKDWFKIKVTRPCNRLPDADEFWVVIKKAIPANTLIDIQGADRFFERESEVGIMYLLKRVINPFGYPDPWLMTSGGVIGASERWWKDQIESGAVEVETIVA